MTTLALAEMLGIVLRNEGLDVVHCADGPRRGRVPGERPDLVLLDVMLPGIDGIEVCRRIRAESGVPIVMLTASTDTVDVVVGLESGADDYVVKPFKPQGAHRPGPGAAAPHRRPRARDAGDRRPRGSTSPATR